VVSSEMHHLCGVRALCCASQYASFTAFLCSFGHLDVRARHQRILHTIDTSRSLRRANEDDENSQNSARSFH
jgi:hypothetical protein